MHPGIRFDTAGNTVESVAAAGMVENLCAEAFLQLLS
jgi:hypothetical protein